MGTELSDVPPAEELEITVDRERCIGAQTCCGLAPTVFVIDDEGLAVVRGQGPRAEVLAAAAGCPTNAISVRLEGRDLHRPAET